jgi:hypothetical protein
LPPTIADGGIAGSCQTDHGSLLRRIRFLLQKLDSGKIRSPFCFDCGARRSRVRPKAWAWLAGDLVFGVFYFFAEGKDREEFVAAGDAAEGRYAEGAPEAGAEAVGKFAGNALDFDISADSAVS